MEVKGSKKKEEERREGSKSKRGEEVVSKVRREEFKVRRES